MPDPRDEYLLSKDHSTRALAAAVERLGGVLVITESEYRRSLDTNVIAYRLPEGGILIQITRPPLHRGDPNELQKPSSSPLDVSSDRASV